MNLLSAFLIPLVFRAGNAFANPTNLRDITASKQLLDATSLVAPMTPDDTASLC
jgi:hypothetical protein